MVFDPDKQVDKIVDIVNTNNFLHHTTILTGSNGSGKSLIRKIIWSRIKSELESSGVEVKENGHLVASVSMERRTNSSLLGFGALNCLARDSTWSPTSQETFHFIDGLLETSDRYLVIDEPEIGMAEEMQLLLCQFINEKLQTLNSHGVLIITHSRTIVKNLVHDQFINMDGLGEDEWLSREVKLPEYTYEEFKKRSHELFLAIEKRLKKS